MAAARADALRCAVLGDLDVAGAFTTEDDLTIADRIQLAAANEPLLEEANP